MKKRLNHTGTHAVGFSDERKEKKIFDNRGRTSLLRKHKLERNVGKKDRIKSILLSDLGWSYAWISKALLPDDQTLRNYWKDYSEGRIHSLLSF